jgi:DNA uptake protein ComE-like DNA-binding protein
MLVPLVRNVIVAAAAGFLLSEPPLTALTVPLSATARAAGPQKQFAGTVSKLDINSASVDQWRTRRRPYHRVEELADKKVIPRGIYEKIKNRMTVGQQQ